VTNYFIMCAIMWPFVLAGFWTTSLCDV